MSPWSAVVLLLAAGEPVTPPRVLSRVEAQVPSGAPAPLQDHVLVEFTIGVDGVPRELTVLESAGPQWDQAAVEALQRWRFSPALHEGVPVVARTRLSFTMPRVASPPDARTAAGDAGAGPAPVPPDDGGALPRPPAVPPDNGGAFPPSSPAPSGDGGAFPPSPPVPSGDGGALPRPPSVPPDDGGALPPPAGPGVAGLPRQELDGGALEGTPASTFGATEPAHPLHEMTTTVVGRSAPRSRGAGDFAIEVGELKVVPRRTPAELLKLAPGILLTNEGGEGHPEQIFLRGFDARQGQDLELTVDGVPLNDVGNLHGNGYADLHALIPELVQDLRVVEGPFDPRQGNFAVAGSADYHLGLSDRGLHILGTYGSFDTSRVVITWGPPGQSDSTFGGLQLFRTAGFGQARAAQNAKAMAQYEGSLSDTVSFRVGGLAYAATYSSAGLLRVDDVEAGRIGFYDSYDPRQGGNSVRAQVHADLHGHHRSLSYDQQLFGVFRLSRVRENYTGFLADVQLPRQSPHQQRGDLIDRDTRAVTVGARGSARYRVRLLDRVQDLEAGYFARVDVVDGLQQRVEAGGNVPYLREYDLQSVLTDIGAYVDLNLGLTDWLTLRGGLRYEALTFDVQDRCAVTDVRRPSIADPPRDQSCLSQRDFGRYREPNQRNATSAGVWLPRGSILVGPWADVTLSASVGLGVRSVDPQFVAQNLEAPFASILAWEGGASWRRTFGPQALTARVAVFGTRVDKDLIFSEQEGRNLIGGATSRLGALFAGRSTGPFHDVSANVTWVRSTFDDTGLLVPYVPDLVVRGDGALFHDVPWWQPMGKAIRARAGVGVTFVGRRALPFGQRSDVIFVIDASVELAWRWVSLGVAATNLLDTRYRLGEFNFASDFRTAGTLPTLVPARMFSAGPPRTVLVTVGLHLGGER